MQACPPACSSWLPPESVCQTANERVRYETRSSLRSLGRSCSFAPSGLRHVPLPTHGLRRGLHSCAASRLLIEPVLHFSNAKSAMTQTPPGLESFLPISPALKSLLRNSVVPPGLGSFFPLFPALEALG